MVRRRRARLWAQVSFAASLPSQRKLASGVRVMAYTACLSGCLAKLARAKDHRLELATYIDRHFEPTPVSLHAGWKHEGNRAVISARLDPSSGEHVFVIDSIPSG